jgi:hypothetical protein
VLDRDRESSPTAPHRGTLAQDWAARQRPSSDARGRADAAGFDVVLADGTVLRDATRVLQRTSIRDGGGRELYARSGFLIGRAISS